MTTYNTDPYECSETNSAGVSASAPHIIIDDSDPYCCEQYVEYTVPTIGS
jgi:hypothetical protein